RRIMTHQSLRDKSAKMKGNARRISVAITKIFGHNARSGDFAGIAAEARGRWVVCGDGVFW
ncbi:MAG: hypothetical protein Q4C47_10005, partial [Planctomycetia bacterium]|nr:hypothetical protein [Planctomycetia bacterium]